MEFKASRGTTQGGIVGCQTIVTSLLPFPATDYHEPWVLKTSIKSPESGQFIPVSISIKSKDFIDIETGQKTPSGIPYGKLARRIFLILVGLAKANNCPLVSIGTKNTETEKLFNIKLANSGKGNFHQFKKIFNSFYYCDFTIKIGSNPAIKVFEQIRNNGESIGISWNKNQLKQIKFTDNFFKNHIIKSSFLVDVEVFFKLTNSILAMDLYNFLLFVTNAKKKDKFSIKLDKLFDQFGSGYSKENARKFKFDLIIALNKYILPAWPSLEGRIKIRSDTLVVQRQLSPDKLLENFLASGLIPTIKPELAHKMAMTWGEKLWDVAEEVCQSCALGILPRSKDFFDISPSKAEKICRALVFYRNRWPSIRTIFGHGFSFAQTIAILNHYGDGANYIIRTNPFRVYCEVPTVDFQTVDNVARWIGFPQEHPTKVQARIVFALKGLARDGHCFATVEMLTNCKWLKKTSPPLLLESLDWAVAHGYINRVESEDVPGYALPSLYRAEEYTAGRLLNILNGRPVWGKINIQHAISEAEKASDVQLTSDQHAAVKCVLENKLSIITGGPGVGKTTTLNVILQILGPHTKKILLVAPTGKAACRLKEITGRDTYTVHRALSTQSQCTVNLQDTELLIIDEASMLDINLMWKILSQLPIKASVLFVGDADQLPPVGPGAALLDMIGSKVIPVAKLTTNHRQKKDSSIIENAHRIINEKMPILEAHSGSDFIFIECSRADIPSRVADLVCTELPAQGFNLFTSIQVLTTVNNGPVGTDHLNRELQFRINPPKISGQYMLGDKIMQMYNDYNIGNSGVFNGEIGRIVDCNSVGPNLEIKFEGHCSPSIYPKSKSHNLSLAYACTIHKSQGSEFPCVVIPITSEHRHMMNRNLLYTGITRARQLVILVGEKAAIETAVKNSAFQRSTTLLDRLKTKDT